MSKNPPEINVVYEAFPGTSQALALDSRANHTLYDGTRGVGKTSVQLMRFRRNVGQGYGTFWRGVIFDKEFDNLADLVAQSKKFFYSFDDGAKFLESASQYKWVWPTGEELLLRHVKKKQDYDGFHGHEYPFIGWNELTKWATSELYDKFMSCNRSSFDPEKDTTHVKASAGMKGAILCSDGQYRIYKTSNGLPLSKMPLEVFSTTNPNGPGHNWVKRQFITIAPRGKLVRKSTVVFDPALGEEREVVKTQIAIFGSYKENKRLPAEYIAELDSIKDPNLRKAWFHGDWDVVSGGAFDDVWDSNINIKPRFVIPETWRVDRGFDWGSTKPYAICWFAEANGDEATLEDGTKWCPVPGSIIMLYEQYGATEIGENKGIKASIKKVCDDLKEIEIGLLNGGWIEDQPRPGPADNAIASNDRDDQTTIEDDMIAEGVRWTKSNKSPGSRKNGMQKVRDMMGNAKTKEGPALYFMDCCQAAINTIPRLPRSEKNLDDVDTDAEDHIYDVVRYRVTAEYEDEFGDVDLRMTF